MYKKLIKKYYLYKIFMLVLPKKIYCHTSCFIMSKYFIKNKFFINISFLIKEVYKIFHIMKYFLKKNYILFFCTTKIFLLNYKFSIKTKLTLLEFKTLLKKKNKVVCAVIYSLKNNNCIFPLIKDKKIPTIGFVSYHHIYNFIDYILPIENKTFSNIFVFHYILKKLLLNVKN